MDNEKAKNEGMDRAGELPLERRAAERRVVADRDVALRATPAGQRDSGDGVLRFGTGDDEVRYSPDGVYVCYEDYAKMESLCDDYERLCQKKDAELTAIRALASQSAAAPVALNKDVEWLMQCAEEAQGDPDVATKIRAHCIAAATREASQPAAPVQPELSDLKKLQIVAGCAVDDLEKIHAALGFPDDQPIDAEDMIEAIEELQAATGTVPAAPPVQQPGDVPISADSLAEILRETADNPVPPLSEQEMTDICTARGWASGAAPSFRDIALVFWVNGALAERQALATTRPSAALTEAQIAAAGRVLADRSAEACNVDREDNWKIYGNDFIEDARAALAASGGALAVPEGWKLVPLEPTESMIYDGGIGRRDQMVDAADVYRAMISAAPAIPAQGQTK